MALKRLTGPILKSKGMRSIFQRKGQKMFKKGKIFENLVKSVQNLLKKGRWLCAIIARNKLLEKALLNEWKVRELQIKEIKEKKMQSEVIKN